MRTPDGRHVRDRRKRRQAYKVEKGETLLLDRLPAKEGDTVDLRAVMFRDSDVVTDPGELEKVKVEATVSEHLGGQDKGLQYKAKKGYRRRQGHRSELTGSR